MGLIHLPPRSLSSRSQKRGSDDPESYLIWTGTLDLSIQVDLTADSFAELVETPVTTSTKRTPMRRSRCESLLFPMGQWTPSGAEEIAEVSVWPSGGIPAGPIERRRPGVGGHPGHRPKPRGRKRSLSGGTG